MLFIFTVYISTAVAVGMIAEKVVRKMSQQSIQLFDACYRYVPT